jgi:hypothetical protein
MKKSPNLMNDNIKELRNYYSKYYNVNKISSHREGDIIYATTLDYLSNKNPFCYLAFSMKLSKYNQKYIDKGFRFAVEPCELFQLDLKNNLTSCVRSIFEQLGWDKANAFGSFIFSKIFGGELFDIPRWKPFGFGAEITENSAEIRLYYGLPQCKNLAWKLIKTIFKELDNSISASSDFCQLQINTYDSVPTILAFVFSRDKLVGTRLYFLCNDNTDNKELFLSFNIHSELYELCLEVNDKFENVKLCTAYDFEFLQNTKLFTDVERFKIELCLLFSNKTGIETLNCLSSMLPVHILEELNKFKSLLEVFSGFDVAYIALGITKLKELQLAVYAFPLEFSINSITDNAYNFIIKQSLLNQFKEYSSLILPMLGKVIIVSSFNCKEKEVVRENLSLKLKSPYLNLGFFESRIFSSNCDTELTKFISSECLYNEVSLNGDFINYIKNIILPNIYQGNSVVLNLNIRHAERFLEQLFRNSEEKYVIATVDAIIYEDNDISLELLGELL